MFDAASAVPESVTKKIGTVPGMMLLPLLISPA